MSYSVNTPCFDCTKKKDGCTDGVVITGAVQGIIHAMPFGTGHKGCGSVTLDCNQKTVEEPKTFGSKIA